MPKPARIGSVRPSNPSAVRASTDWVALGDTGTRRRKKRVRSRHVVQTATGREGELDALFRKDADGLFVQQPARVRKHRKHVSDFAPQIGERVDNLAADDVPPEAGSAAGWVRVWEHKVTPSRARVRSASHPSTGFGCCGLSEFVGHVLDKLHRPLMRNRFDQGAQALEGAVAARLVSQVELAEGCALAGSQIGTLEDAEEAVPPKGSPRLVRKLGRDEYGDGKPQLRENRPGFFREVGVGVVEGEEQRPSR